MHDGLDMQHASKQGDGTGNAPAVFEEIQIVYSKPVRKAGNKLLSVRLHLFNGRARAFFLHSMVDEQPLAHGRALCVHNKDLTLRELPTQFFYSDARGVVGVAQSGRKGEVDYVLPLLQDRLERVGNVGRVERGGADGAFLGQRGVKILVCDIALVQVVAVFLAVQGKGKRNYL